MNCVKIPTHEIQFLHILQAQSVFHSFMDYLKSYKVAILSVSQGREIHMTGAKYLTDFQKTQKSEFGRD